MALPYLHFPLGDRFSSYKPTYFVYMVILKVLTVIVEGVISFHTDDSSGPTVQLHAGHCSNQLKQTWPVKGQLVNT